MNTHTNTRAKPIDVQAALAAFRHAAEMARKIAIVIDRRHRNSITCCIWNQDERMRRPIWIMNSQPSVAINRQTI